MIFFAFMQKNQKVIDRLLDIFFEPSENLVKALFDLRNLMRTEFGFEVLKISEDKVFVYAVSGAENVSASTTPSVL